MKTKLNTKIDNSEKEYQPHIDGFKILHNAIICAACKSDKDGTVVTSFRHFDSRMHDKIKLLKNEISEFFKYQGFVDMYGNFQTRKDALKIFNDNNQYSACDDRGRGNELYSENLY
jgi:hypothetical protein